MTKPLQKKTIAKKVKPQQAAIPAAAAGADPMGVLDGLSTYAPETLEANQKAFEKSGASAFVIKDEWHGQIQESNPFDKAATPWVDANPDKHFRFISEAHSKRRTNRDYVPVKDGKGREIRVGRQVLSYIPQDVHLARKSAIEQRTAQMRQAAEENFQENAARFERESQGAVKMVKKGIVGGVPVGVNTVHGHRIS
jgi:hypothetical protein